MYLRSAISWTIAWLSSTMGRSRAEGLASLKQQTYKLLGNYRVSGPAAAQASDGEVNGVMGSQPPGHKVSTERHKV